MEQIWIQQAVKGSEAAFAQLVQAHQAQVYRLCFRICGNAEDAADMTQETFVKVWQKLPEFRADSAFSTWLHQIATHSCLDLLRSKKRRAALSTTMEDEETLELTDPAPTPESAVLADENRRELRQALSCLDPEQRALLSLRVVQERSYQEISAILQIPEGTVKSRLSRARENLRSHLRRIGNQPKAASSNTAKGGRRA